MAKKKKRQRYGDYCEIINGELYASVNIPIGGGKYKRKRKRVQSRTDARNWALGELDKAKHGTSGELETFLQLAEWYKEHFLVAPTYERGLKVSGVKSWKRYRDDLDRMSVHFGPKRLASFSESDLRRYANIRREFVKQVTINRDMALLRSMFRKGREADPSIRVPKFPINMSAEHERNRVLSFEEEKRLLAACEEIEELEYERKGKTVKANHASNRGHLRDIITVAVDTALRANELFTLHREDVEAGVIRVRAGNSKTQRERQVPITSRVKAILDAIDTDGPLFPYKSVKKAFATACKRAKIKDLTFHDLRHTATTRMIASGTPYMEVMKITGHTQIKTFLRYLNPQTETVQAAASRLDDLISSS